MKKLPAQLFFNGVFAVFAFCYLPFFLMKLKQADDPKRVWAERFGFLPPDLASRMKGKRVFWIHAVSVGEVAAIRKFVEGLLQKFPSVQVVLTTVTATGQKMAQTMAQERVAVLYFPFDFSFAVSRFFEVLRPERLFLVETEIWPNLILEARARHIPVGLVNARLSEKSFGRYLKIRGLIKVFFEALDFVLAQTREDGERFLELGVRPEKVYVIGNMKFDNLPFEDHEPISKEELKKAWGFSSEERVWVLGSTHPGEERDLAKVFLRIRGRFPGLKLLIAPRHIERCPKLLKELRALGLRVVLSTDPDPSGFEVLLLNQIGILKKIYALSDAVFVGGSLVRHGGQNPIEPAMLRSAIFHGPYVFNFASIYRQMDREGAAISVQNAGELEAGLTALLENQARTQELGERAFRIVQDLRGATDQTLEWLQHFVNQSTPKAAVNVG